MSELDDVIVKDSNKRFRLRIHGSLRSIGVSQIIGTRRYFEIEFLNGYSIQIPYPDNLERLPDAIESELLLETLLSRKHIDNIKFYVKDYIE